MADGRTHRQAVANAEGIIREWLGAAKELGRPIARRVGCTRGVGGMRAARRRAIVLLAGVVLIAALTLRAWGRWLWRPVHDAVAGRRSVADAVGRYGAAARERFLPRFDAAGVAYPPPRLALLGFKAEKRLELWADRGGTWVFVHAYPILGASGTAGPKLRQGDRQVPEGIYRVEYLNPQSICHLSMKLDYPNAFDRAHAKAEGRTKLGGDIFIHGGSASIGCLAVGDRAIEELFAMVHRVGVSNVTAILAPNDLRTASPATDLRSAPAWVAELYQHIEEALKPFTATRGQP